MTNGDNSTPGNTPPPTNNGTTPPNTHTKHNSQSGSRGFWNLKDKTFWDWLQLLIIPVVLAVATIVFNIQQNLTSLQVGQQQHQTDINIAADQQRETTLQTYLDHMSDLLFNDNLRDPKLGTDARAMAQARTLTALRTLDSRRKALLLKFLYDANLINREPFPIVNLAQADLSGANLPGANLSGADLALVNLSGADLSGADLSGAYLSGVELTNARLDHAKLRYAQLTQEISLSKAYPGNTQFIQPARLIGANLTEADLTGADLTGADLSKANLTNATLNGTDLTGINRQGATITPEQIAQALFKTWQVTTVGNTLEISYGIGASFPQYGALDLKSGYLRLNYGPKSGWGTSIILLPALWSKTSCPTDYCQGAPVTSISQVDGTDLVLSIKGTIAGLQTTLKVRLSPPTSSAIWAQVAANIVAGTLQLDGNHPWEAFKPVMLSSMHVSPTQWDSQKSYADNQDFVLPLPGDTWIIDPPVFAQKFGLVGGTSSWKTNAPTVEVRLQEPMQVTGWLTRSSNPNDDNVGFWCASNKVLMGWNYMLIVSASPLS